MHLWPTAPVLVTAGTYPGMLSKQYYIRPNDLLVPLDLSAVRQVRR